MIRSSAGFALFTLFLTAVACKEPPPPSPAAPTGPAAPGNASIAGSALFEGSPPPPERSPLSAFPECAQLAAGSTYPARIQAKNGGIKDVFVYVKSGLRPAAYPTPTEPVVLDQKACVFLPRVFGLQVGQTLEIRNSDPMLHNVHSFAKNTRPFNLALPFKGRKVTQTFQAPEVMAEIRCDIHGWMKAYAGVLPHPYFTVTGEDGKFRIGGLPAGEYAIEAWHEALGTQAQAVTLGSAESRTISFRFNRARP